MVFTQPEGFFFVYKNKFCLPPGYWLQCYDNSDTFIFPSAIPLGAGICFKHTASMSHYVSISTYKWYLLLTLLQTNRLSDLFKVCITPKEFSQSAYNWKGVYEWDSCHSAGMQILCVGIKVQFLLVLL